MPPERERGRRTKNGRDENEEREPTERTESGPPQNQYLCLYGWLLCVTALPRQSVNQDLDSGVNTP